MKNLLTISLLTLLFGCTGEVKHEKKMLEIADRQMSFNQYQIIQLEDAMEPFGNSPSNKEIMKNVREFHDRIMIFQKEIRDKNLDKDQVRNKINEFLDNFLQEVDPELNHESFLDGAVSRGLLAIELANIEKSFILDQEFKLVKNARNFDLHAIIVPEKHVIKDGEPFKGYLRLMATSENWDQNVKMEVNGIEIQVEEGKGVIEFKPNATKSGLNEMLLKGKIVLADTTYEVDLSYWIIK